MNYRNRAIKAYKSVSSDKKEVEDSFKDELAVKPSAANKDEPTGFLKLTKEKADYSKIAKFLLLLGKEEAAKVVKHLSPLEVEKISKEISQTKRVDRVEAESLLKEFGFDREKEAVRVRGGAEAAAQILTRAFGKKESDRLLRKAVPQVVEGPFSFLNDLGFEQLILLLKGESAQVIALVLRYLDPALSSKVIEAMDKKISSAVIKRIAKGGAVSTDVIQGMEESLKEKIRNQGQVESEEIDGPSALAEILKYMDIGDEQKILDSLEEDNAEVSRDIKEKLFTIDTVLHINRNDLQKILNEMSEREIAIILRRVDEEVKKKIR
ncbi:MAG: hypothetical protein JEY91_18760, partial [Spirochaetaceae bacterium]|nr:hypothetical protein [Spirochaetaceae bacterium]